MRIYQVSHEYCDTNHNLLKESNQTAVVSTLKMGSNIFHV
jgi:hypothetical protein